MTVVVVLTTGVFVLQTGHKFAKMCLHFYKIACFTNFLKKTISTCVLVTLCLYCISDKLQITKIINLNPMPM